MKTPTFGTLLAELGAELDRELQAGEGQSPTNGSYRAEVLREVIGDVRESADLPRREDFAPDNLTLMEGVPEAVLDDVRARVESAGIRITLE